ncbi:hypothetical protein EF918_29785, partial [Streptomyces sp. WAC06614]
MLVHSKAGRWAVWTVFALLFLPLFALPLLVVLAASFAGHWSGAFPSDPTTAHYAAAGRGVVGGGRVGGEGPGPVAGE